MHRKGERERGGTLSGNWSRDPGTRRRLAIRQCQCQCQSWIYIAHKRKASNALVRPCLSELLAP